LSIMIIAGNPKGASRLRDEQGCREWAPVGTEGGHGYVVH